MHRRGLDRCTHPLAATFRDAPWTAGVTGLGYVGLPSAVATAVCGQQRHGQRVWEVVDAAATNPVGRQPLHPGPGIGGHGSPLAPRFLAWRAKEFRVAGRGQTLLNEPGTPVSRTRVRGLGAACRRAIADDRGSPANDVPRLLQRRGAQVGTFVPQVARDRLERHAFDVVAADATRDDRDLGVVLTDRDPIDHGRGLAQVGLVFDTRSAHHRREIDREEVVVL